MLHGHAKIELTNVKTGEKKVIEHDNYMTDYLHDLLAPYGAQGDCFARMWASLGGSTLWTKAGLFGGVILFEDSMDNDASNYQFPQTNKMVAHGGNLTYGGEDLTMGSYNTGLSEISASQAKFVWDWTQERGNGTISSLGLAVNIGGIAGSGKDEKSNETSSDLNPNIAGWRIGIGTYGSGTLIGYIDDANGFVYTYSIDGELLIINKYVFPTGVVNPIRLKLRGDHTISLDSDTLVDTTTVPIPLLGANRATHCYGTKLYVVGKNVTIAAGGTFTLYVYDFVDGTYQSLTITNNTGVSLWFSNETYRNTSWFVYDGYLYCEHSLGSSQYSWGYINLSDNTDAGVLKKADGSDFTHAATSYVHAYYVGFQVLGPSTYAGNNRSQIAFVYNHKQVRFLNAGGMAGRGGSYASYAQSICNGGTAVSKVRNYFMEYQNNNHYLSLLYNPFALMTKNNLDSPITKTADMTMRVTYTITEATE